MVYTTYTKRYEPKELEIILQEFERETPLHTLADKLNRSSYGVAIKMINLSNADPETYDPETIRRYTREEIRKHRGDVKAQRKRWKLRQKGKRVKQGEEVHTQQVIPPEIDVPKFRAYLCDFAGSFPSKQECAGHLGIHKSQLSRYLHRVAPSERLLRRLCELQQVDYDTFVSGFRLQYR